MWLDQECHQSSFKLYVRIVCKTMLLMLLSPLITWPALQTAHHFILLLPYAFQDSPRTKQDHVLKVSVYTQCPPQHLYTIPNACQDGQAYYSNKYNRAELPSAQTQISCTHIKLQTAYFILSHGAQSLSRSVFCYCITNSTHPRLKAPHAS